MNQESRRLLFSVQHRHSADLQRTLRSSITALNRRRHSSELAVRQAALDSSTFKNEIQDCLKFLQSSNTKELLKAMSDFCFRSSGKDLLTAQVFQLLLRQLFQGTTEDSQIVLRIIGNIVSDCDQSQRQFIGAKLLPTLIHIYWARAEKQFKELTVWLLIKLKGDCLKNQFIFTLQDFICKEEGSIGLLAETLKVVGELPFEDRMSLLKPLEKLGRHSVGVVRELAIKAML